MACVHALPEVPSPLVHDVWVFSYQQYREISPHAKQEKVKRTEALFPLFLRIAMLYSLRSQPDFCMTNFLIYFTIAIAAILLIEAGVYLLRKFVDHRRSMHRVYLRVMIPRKDSDADEKKETIRDFKEQVGLMEQLLVAM